MEEQDRIRYQTLFYCQKLEDGFLSGDNARALFIRSKLPLLELTRIWKLADVTRDNKLDVSEFSLAMHFIELKLLGGEIPKQSDVINVENNQDVVLPIISVEEKQKINSIFAYTDKNSQGFLEIDIVKPMFSLSGLSPSTLSRIWNIADLDKDGKLCLFEFTIAMYLLKNCINGLLLNGPVNPFSCFPAEEDSVCSYKEKLSRFDKDFLLKQKTKKPELFLNSMKPADPADFELLAGYLFFSPQDESESNFVDENRNFFRDEKDNYAHDQQESDHVLARDQEHDSVVEDGVQIDCMETIHRQRVNKSEVDINLDNIFETVDKEKIGESDDTPKFIARAPVGYGEIEEDEEETPVILPYFQRRTYFGKDLIFEDPVGSEVIGDVEFEVDFEYIINDIEKETVDEERRLPIARVLPMYKIPSIVDEEAHEKSATTKSSEDVDLNFNSAKTGEFNEQENRNLFERGNGVVVGAVAKDSEAHVEMIANEKSPSHQDHILTNSRQNSKQKNDEIIGTANDIVEQKRLLLLSQKEERKKLHENRRNENNVQNSSISSSFPGMRKTEENEKNACNQTHESDRKYELIDSEYYSGTQGNISTQPNNVTGEVQAKLISNEENQDEEEESKRKIREAEEKEKLLLERIEYLEKKRRKFYEKKKRELSLKNVKQKHNVYPNREENVNMKEEFMKYPEQNSLIGTSPDPWKSHTQRPRKDNEDEKRRLAEALAAKRQTEAELERQREEVLRAAEERRLEEAAKKREEEKTAKERKRNFMENLQRLKQRVLTEEEEKSKENKSPQEKRELNSKPIHNTEKLSPDLSSASKYQPMSGHAKGNDATKTSSVHKNVMSVQTGNSKDESYGNRMQQDFSDSSTAKSDNKDMSNREDQRKADEMRRANFKSNRDLFMKKIQTETEQNTQVEKRGKDKKVRPKSFYSGMFNKPVHQIIDDSLLVQNVDPASVGDLVDEEALKQFQREQEVKKEHEKVNKLRSSLERESSYSVENVEQLFCNTDTDSKKQDGNDWRNLEKKTTMSKSSHPHRRSLVNTLTTEWNSFIDVLDEDKRRESETVKMRQEISSQRKCSPAQTTVTARTSVTTPVQVVKSDNSKETLEEKEIFLSVPCFLYQDDAWEKSEEDFQPPQTSPQAERSLKSDGLESDNKKLHQKNIIKENAPKRKTDLAHAWTHMILQQQQNTED